MGLFNSNFHTIKAAMDVSMLRQEIHAHNIANAETPGYKRKYVVFEELLQKVMEKKVKLARTDPRHMGEIQEPVRPVVRTDYSTSYRNDGNNVDIDYEMVEMTKNGLRYQVLSRLMSMNIDRYNAVIRGVR